MDYLHNLPEAEELLQKHNDEQGVLEVNGHLHSPYSFCPFKNIEQMFQMAGEEGVKVLGINDFYTVDGYSEFTSLGQKHRIFPLLNIEFMGLMKDMQQQGILINDWGNPGRTYFSGKALKHPIDVGAQSMKFLTDIQESSQVQMREMISKADALLEQINARFNISYVGIREKYAKLLVRERHIARAIREAAMEHYKTRNQVIGFYTSLFEGKKLSATLDDTSGVENEVRSAILKSGGRAFVPEDADAFPPLQAMIDFILDAGGIPCQPFLLDNKLGELTPFESDWDRVDEVLQSNGISCIEAIPLRNTHRKLKEFVDFFRGKKYIITFGTEHNSPGIFPLRVKAADQDLGPELKKVSYEGCCVLAAHQYLVARGQKGFVDKEGKGDVDNQDYYRDLGNAIIKEFTN